MLGCALGHHFRSWNCGREVSRLLALVALAVGTTHALAETSIKLAEPSKLAYRCGNAFTDNEEEARARGCKLVSADPSIQEQLSPYGRYREVAANHNLRIFVDKSKAVKEGKLLKAWTILSYHRPQPMASQEVYQSVQSFEYYDCDARTSATKRQVYYKDRIAQGEVIGSLDLTFKFEQDPPGSMGALVMQSVCEK
ncbi:MAG: hypothetical protein KAY82_05590 [Hylemonella sp.]|nr:hypothetical protein [Hylemonella sp.]